MKRTLATVVAFCKSSRYRRAWGIPISVEDVLAAENLIIKWLQQNHFAEDLRALKANKTLNKSSRLCRLDPVLDTEGILRVGGRLRKTILPKENKHPAILPKDNIQWYHKEIQHLGRTSTVGELGSRENRKRENRKKTPNHSSRARVREFFDTRRDSFYTFIISSLIGPFSSSFLLIGGFH